MSLQAQIDAIFGPDGWLVKHQGFRHEPAQQAYALSVAQWLEGEAHAPLALLEGETGTGKTLGYLIPLLWKLADSGDKGCIATHTIALQNQMMAGDIPLALECLTHFGKPFVDVQQLVGRQNFIDPARTEAALQHLMGEGVDIPHAADLIEGAYRCADGDALIASYRAEYGPLPEGLNNSDICMVLGRDTAAEAEYEAQLARCRDAQLVITSHAMCLVNRVTPNRVFDSDESPIAHLIIDEADLLTAAAEAYGSLRRHPKQLATSFEQIEPLLTGKKSKSALIELRETLEVLDDKLRSFDRQRVEASSLLFDLKDKHPLEKTVHQSMAYVDDLIATIVAAAKRNIDTTDYKLTVAFEEAKQAQSFVKEFCERSSAGASIWGVSWSQERRIPAIEKSTPFPARLIKRYFTNETAPARVLFTSATLSNGNNGAFGNIKGEIRTFASNLYCVERCHAPLDFGSVDYVLCDLSIPKPFAGKPKAGAFDERWLNYAAKLIEAASTRGNTLVLTASYHEAALLAEKITTTPAHCHKAGRPLSELIDAFKEAGGVLISPALWQGHSLRDSRGGQLFSQLVISRVPYTPPQHYRQQAMIRHLQKWNDMDRGAAKNIIEGLRAIQVVRQLRQGFGRLIRKASDAGTIWIADPRFPVPGSQSKRAYSGLTASIPPRFKEAYENAPIFMESGELSLPEQMPEELMEWL